MSGCSARPQHLRLLYMINGLGPGGAERSLAELLPHYLAAGIQPVIVCMRPKAEGVESVVRQAGCEIRFLEDGGRLRQIRRVRRMLDNGNVHLIHTTLYESDIVGRVAAAGTGIPVLTSLVNTTFDPVRRKDPQISRLGFWKTKAIDGWTSRHLTAHFHAVSEAVRDSAVDALRIRAERVTVVERGRSRERLGFPSQERREAARRRLGLGDEDEVIVNVARQEYQKGQKYLLAAVAKLSTVRPRSLLLLVGRDGRVSHELRKQHDVLSLGNRVRFLNYRDDVPEILAAADVFAFPSLYEGASGAVIEAMALGLPIVASDIPAHREVMEDRRNGFLVKPESGGQLATALERILDDRALATGFAARSLQIFAERFTIERSAGRMIDLYHRVVAAPGSRRSNGPLYDVEPSGVQ